MLHSTAPGKTTSAIVAALAFAIFVCGSWVTRVDAQDLTGEAVGSETVPGPNTNSGASSAPQQVSQSSVSLDKDEASSVGHHHYNSDAERAQDDLLITEVKRALADDGLSKGNLLEVDADHGTVTLSGIVASAGDATAAGKDAAAVRGVVAVHNRLQLH